jgi:hypothetical protein
MNDINAVVERGRKRYGAAEFDQASQIVIDHIQDASAREQFVAAVARNAEGEDIVYRRAQELRSKALGREGPKNDEREARIAKINVKSPLYDTIDDRDWNAAFDARYNGAKRGRR